MLETKNDIISRPDDFSNCEKNKCKVKSAPRPLENANNAVRYA